MYLSAFDFTCFPVECDMALRAPYLVASIYFMNRSGTFGAIFCVFFKKVDSVNIFL
jgi:hypothetical protein